MTPLRVIVVMIEPPLPFGNAVARWFYVLLRELVARGHRTTAFAACITPARKFRILAHTNPTRQRGL